MIIAEEDNLMINLAHPDAKNINATKMRRFGSDHRVCLSQTARRWVWIPAAGTSGLGGFPA